MQRTYSNNFYRIMSIIYTYRENHNRNSNMSYKHEPTDFKRFCTKHVPRLRSLRDFNKLKIKIKQVEAFNYDYVFFVCFKHGKCEKEPLLFVLLLFFFKYLYM